MTDAIVEIRDYTIDNASIGAYKEWADTLAAPWLRANLDVIDFWLDDDIDAEVGGSDPHPYAHGQPNVCWIIRWPSKADRDARFGEVMGSPGWREVWAQHPCPDAYLQTNIRFMRAART